MLATMSRYRHISVWLVTAALPFALAGCNDRSHIKIGYLGGLTGRTAGLGVAGRDAVQLAVEEVNRAGGIGGRQIDLVEMDDRQDEESARSAVSSMIEEDVSAIVGPMTSAMALAILPVINEQRMVVISPTVTTNQLSGREDYFFRLTVPLKVNADNLAAYAAERGLKRFSVVLDTGNAAYTEDWLVSFEQSFKARGGRVVHQERFRSESNTAFLPLVERTVASRPDAILLLGGAIDTAMMAQQVRKLGSAAPLFASEWSFTSDVINFGGAAVEGMLSFVTYNPVSRTERHRSFIANFKERFGYEPSFAAVLAYEAAKLLIAGLERNSRGSDLKDTIERLGPQQGLQGMISINRFGDAERATFLAVIREGRFTVVEGLSTRYQ